MKEDLYKRLQRLNKGSLARHLVRARDLADAKAKSGTDDKQDRPPGERKPAKRTSRKRLTEEMIRPAGSRKTPASPVAKPQNTGLGALAGLHHRLKGLSPNEAVKNPKPTDPFPSPAASAAGHQWKALQQQIEGEVRETPYGRCLVRSALVPAGGWIGSQQVPESVSVHPEIIAKLSRDERFASLKPTDLLFLDTETTGLAGGTGTVAFLVGLAWWSEQGFQIVQYFMPDYPEEMALLHLLDQQIRDSAALVTYNGKAFDIPLLSVRFIRNRSEMGSRLMELPHLDLLHPARRLWKQRLGDCSLTNLEAEILGFEREEDVPGWEIPQIYFQFLSDGEIGPLPTVFVHNRHDLVTLAQLAARACQLYREPLGDPSLSGIDLFSLARSLELDGSSGSVVQVLEEARLVSLDSDTRRKVLRHLSRIYKRQKNWDAAVAIWQELGESDGILEVFSFEEMAKFYEHVARDLRLAAAVTSRILDALGGNACIDSTPYPDLDEVGAAFAHRLRRIERKLVRAEHEENR